MAGSRAAHGRFAELDRIYGPVEERLKWWPKRAASDP